MLEWGYICPHFEELYFYHSDYLGHTEYITDAGGYPYQYFYYTPFGESLITQHANTGGYSTSFRFNAKELDEETGNYYYGARYYNPRWSVWLGVDPKAHAFPYVTSYNYLLNNTIMMVDPGGDSVEVSHMMKNQPNEYATMRNDLESITGLCLGTSNSNKLTYEINPDATQFSQEARDFLISAIEDKTRDVLVRSTTSNGESRGGDFGQISIIQLSKSQIDGFINGAFGLDSRTMGYGMTFLHELDHTSVGSGGATLHSTKEKSDFGALGSTVNRMNKIRGEMGSSFGQRLSYARKDGYIPFSVFDLGLMKRGLNPSTSYIYAP
jgi:RHS repeat-associated protein